MDKEKKPSGCEKDKSFAVPGGFPFATGRADGKVKG